MSKLYKVHEFAELSGVTVKALHHYDRIGLLKARRSDTGYRIYTDHDLERLEQIVALKFIGLGLGQIKVVLGRKDVGLPEALRRQREVLKEKQRLLARAIGAITRAETEIRTGQPVDAGVLKRLIKAIEIENQFDFISRHFSGETLAMFGELAATMKTWPRDEWKALECDITVALKDPDSTGERSQAILERAEKLREQSPEMFGLLTRISTDPAFLEEARNALADNWPAGSLSRMKRSCHEAGQFFLKAYAARAKAS